MRSKWIISTVAVLFFAFLINHYDYKIQRMYEWVIHEEPLMPLKDAVITQPYGDFIDPVNKMKTFKNFVTLQSNYEVFNELTGLDARMLAMGIR